MGFFGVLGRLDSANQYVRPFSASFFNFGWVISMPRFASLTVNPDHHAKSLTVAGPRVKK